MDHLTAVSSPLNSTPTSITTSIATPCINDDKVGFNNACFSDVIIELSDRYETKRVYSHGIILAVKSEFFAKLLIYSTQSGAFALPEMLENKRLIKLKVEYVDDAIKLIEWFYVHNDEDISLFPMEAMQLADQWLVRGKIKLLARPDENYFYYRIRHLVLNILAQEGLEEIKFTLEEKMLLTMSAITEFISKFGFLTIDIIDKYKRLVEAKYIKVDVPVMKFTDLGRFFVNCVNRFMIELANIIKSILSKNKTASEFNTQLNNKIFPSFDTQFNRAIFTCTKNLIITYYVSNLTTDCQYCDVNMQKIVVNLAKITLLATSDDLHNELDRIGYILVANIKRDKIKMLQIEYPSVDVKFIELVKMALKRHLHR